jgi:hypothetical protein
MGGIHFIRHEIIDDCALARQLKRAGGRVWLGLTQQAASIRPYHSFAEIERMIARSAFSQLRHSLILLLIACVGLFLTYIAPVGLLLGRAWWLGTVSCVLMVLSYLPMVRFYGLSPIWAATLPVAATFYMAATINSALRYWLGRGGEWKGRAQDRRGAVVND